MGGRLRKAAAGLIVGRMACPASERATYRWLQKRSGLGELIGLDFGTVSPMLLYRASDVLVRHREAIEAHVSEEAMSLFDLQPTVTLYDLTKPSTGVVRRDSRLHGAGIRRTSAVSVRC